MLRAKIYINRDELDDIQIVRTDTQNAKNEYKYNVKTLECSFSVYHARAEGWIKLLIKVLKKMQNKILKEPPKPKVYDKLIENLLKNYKE